MSNATLGYQSAPQLPCLRRTPSFGKLLAMTSLAFAMPDPTLDTSGIVLPPSDLYSDEPEIESYLHLTQMILLLDGALLPAAKELAQQVETAERRAAHLAEKLRELGVDPDSVK